MFSVVESSKIRWQYCEEDERKTNALVGHRAIYAADHTYSDDVASAGVYNARLQKVNALAILPFM